MIGKSLGHYEIRDSLGAGGMGEVFLARDGNLRRDVAIKLLPEDLAEDAAHLARLEREAHLLASINHPNIATIHSLEAVDGARFLVLELVRGKSLDAILARGGLPTGEALAICRQVAEALDAAHGAGIIHRDLKPANVMITEDRRAKVLDFGIAKDLRRRESDSATSGATDLTAAGAIVGTAPYMSPEQIRGQAVDKRTDIWSFGCVLFETLTGQRAFAAETVADTVSEVLRHDPDWGALPDEVPGSVRLLLTRCLDKDRRRRLRDIGDAWIELEHASIAGESPELVRQRAGIIGSDDAGRPTARAPEARRRLWGLAGAVAIVGALAGYLGWTLKPAPPVTIRTFAIAGESGVPLRWSAFHSDVTVSPDGKYVVYQVEGDEGEHSLYRRAIDQLDGALLFTGMRSHNPFFSNDGQWIAFEDPDPGVPRLRRVPILGGPVETIGVLPDTSFAGGSWGADGTIIFGSSVSGLHRIPADGGDREVLTTPAEGKAHIWPELLPTGRHALFTVRPGEEGRVSDIHLLDLQSGEHHMVIESGTRPRFIEATGHVVFGGPSEMPQRNSLRAVRFDPASGTASGPQTQLFDGLITTRSHSSLYAVSREGTLIYGTGSTEPDRRLLATVDRTGTAETLPLPADRFLHPRVSPDGSRIVYQTVDGGGRGTVWLHELGDAAAPRRMTVDGSNTRPLWTTDGRHVVYSSDKDGPTSAYRQSVAGDVPERLTMAAEGEDHWVESWSVDGVLAFSVQSAGNSDIYTVVPGDPVPQLFAGGEGIQSGAAFSPDGTWLAFGSDDGRSRAWRVLAARYPRTDELYEVAREGLYPQWANPDEIVFREPNSEFPAVLRLAMIDRRAGLRVLSEITLPVAPTVPTGFYRDFDAVPGTQNLIAVIPDPAAPPSDLRLIVVTDWFDELRRRVDGS